MPIATLPNRAILRVAGDECEPFLDRLVTCAVERATPGHPRYGALLTPQGKIIADFLLFRDPDGFWLDAPQAVAADLAKRLGMYRLRAKVTITDMSDSHEAVAGWDEAEPDGVSGPDPRDARLGWRAIGPRGTDSGEMAVYEERRIERGIPDGGRDFAYGDAFPHEADMDQLGGVDFDKGCYVGQEVVSRMQHRGTARTRIVPVLYADGRAAEPGTDVTAGDKVLGRTGSAIPGRGLALLRLDRLGDALEAGLPILAGTEPVRVAKPDWARFPVPGEADITA